MNLSDRERIGRDLWPHHCRFLVRKALQASDGTHIPIPIGEAETMARRETEREIAKRLKFYETMDTTQIRPKQRRHKSLSSKPLGQLR